MAQIKTLKIAADGVPLEHTAGSDDVTYNSLTAGVSINFTDPTSGFFNATAGNLIMDDVMGKERSNAMTSASDILFPVVTDVAGELDAFKIPNIVALPSATPAASSTEGYLVAHNGSVYNWDGAAWNDLSVSNQANNLLTVYTADEALAARDFVYISAADNVSKAIADNTSASYAIGLAEAVAIDTASVNIISAGAVGGFTGLTAGSRYYLDDVTAGDISASPVTASGKTIVQVGYAKSTTSLEIQILQLGRRA